MVYILRMRGSDYYKIGYTGRDVLQRVSDLQTGCPEPLDVIATLEGDEALEYEMHRRFWQYKTQGGDEWFCIPSEIMKGFEHVKQENPSPVGGPSAFDVRPLRGRQCDPATAGREDVPRRAKAFDRSGHQSVFIAIGGELQERVPPVLWQAGEDDSLGDTELLQH